MKNINVKSIEKSLPILGFNGDIIISNNIDMGFGLRLFLPELLSVSTEHLYMLHDTFQRAVNLLPENTLLHKQDFFFVEHFNANKEGKDRIKQNSLDRNYFGHFEKRPYLKHECYVYVSLLNVGLLKNYLSSSLIFSQKQKMQESYMNEKIGELRSNLISVFTQSGISCKPVSQHEAIGTEKHTWINRTIFNIKF